MGTEADEPLPAGYGVGSGRLVLRFPSEVAIGKLYRVLESADDAEDEDEPWTQPHDAPHIPTLRAVNPDLSRVEDEEGGLGDRLVPRFAWRKAPAAKGLRQGSA